MKIAIVGNTNNFPYLLGVGLRNLGYDVTLFVNSKYQLNRPENRDWRYRFWKSSWIRDYSHIDEQEYFSVTAGVRELVSELEKAELVIANDIGPSLLPLMRKKVRSVALLTGSDLTYYASQNLPVFRVPSVDDADPATNALRRQWRTEIKEFVARQRAGILSSETISYFPPGIDIAADMMFKEIGADHLRTTHICLAETHRVKYSVPSNRRALRIFCATRLNFGTLLNTRSDLDNKGSDIMIKGLGLFYEKTRLSLDIHLVRKGDSVKEIEALCRTCGIDSLVTWHDTMSLPKIWKWFRRSDIVFEQFGKSMIGMAGLDAMATGRPVIANAKPDISDFKLPVCQAETPEEVAGQLELLQDREFRIQKGKLGREYVERELSPEANAERLMKKLEI